MDSLSADQAVILSDKIASVNLFTCFIPIGNGGDFCWIIRLKSSVLYSSKIPIICSFLTKVLTIGKDQAGYTHYRFALNLCLLLLSEIWYKFCLMIKPTLYTKLFLMVFFIIKIYDFRSEKLPSIVDEEADLSPRTQLHDELTTTGN